MATRALLFGAGVGLGATVVLLTRPRSDREVKVTEPASTDLLAKQGSTEVLRYGNPGPLSDMFVRQAYAVGYDRRTRNPAWTAEHLTAENMKRPPLLPTNNDSENVGSLVGRVDRSNSQFVEDDSIPELYRAKLSDYFRSGYDRGHMVPAADAKRSQSAMNETFLLSNIAPQVGEGFNRDYWAFFEDFARRLTTSFRDVYVFTLPLYLPKLDPVTKKHYVSYEVIGNPPNVAVPTHFAKVIYGRSGPSDPANTGALGAFVLPNTFIPNDKALAEFSVPVETVERASGVGPLFGDDVRRKARSLCSQVACAVVVREFDDAQKRGNGGAKGRRPRSDTI